jgi:hypothetical protein
VFPPDKTPEIVDPINRSGHSVISFLINSLETLNVIALFTLPLIVLEIVSPSKT